MPNTSYSQFYSPFWKNFKSYFPDRSETDYCKTARNILINAIAITQKLGNGATWRGAIWDRDTTYVDLATHFLWHYRRLKHYFLAPGVAAFCIGSIKEFSEDFCKTLPPCPHLQAPPQTNETAFIFEIEPHKIQSGFALHFPTQEKRRSMIVIPDARTPRDSKNCNGYYFVTNDGEDIILMQKNTPNEEVLFNTKDSDQSKLIFGLSLYMDAFPDTVVPASSENVYHIGHYTGPHQVVNRHKIIDEEERASVSPHWRRGHFRLLTSIQFVHKKGQTIYVRGTFVKGQAFDVLDDIPATKPEGSN